MCGFLGGGSIPGNQQNVNFRNESACTIRPVRGPRHPYNSVQAGFKSLQPYENVPLLPLQYQNTGNGSGVRQGQEDAYGLMVGTYGRRGGNTLYWVVSPDPNLAQTHGGGHWPLETSVRTSVKSVSTRGSRLCCMRPRTSRARSAIAYRLSPRMSVGKMPLACSTRAPARSFSFSRVCEIWTLFGLTNLPPPSILQHLPPPFPRCKCILLSVCLCCMCFMWFCVRPLLRGHYDSRF